MELCFGGKLSGHLLGRRLGGRKGDGDLRGEHRKGPCAKRKSEWGRDRGSCRCQRQRSPGTPQEKRAGNNTVEGEGIKKYIRIEKAQAVRTGRWRTGMQEGKE